MELFADVIMENGRGGRQQKGNNNIYCSQEVSRKRSFNKKPPRGSWQPAVPSWEKTFCKVVGSLDWETLLDRKRFVYLYDNVVKWDDSAGEEAFHNAKNRFLAEMRGFPCDISLPDPDLYIDEVDWDSKIDSELLSDLESVVPDVAENNEEPVVIFGDNLLCNQGFSAAGWGECEEDLRKAKNSSSNNHGNPWEGSLCKGKGSAKENGWGDSGNNACVLDVSSGGVIDTGWDNSWSWNKPCNKKVGPKDPQSSQKGGTLESWDVNKMKNSAGGFVSRYKT